MDRHSHRTARRALIGLAAVLALAVPAQAEAAGAGLSFGSLTVTSAGDSANLTVTRDGAGLVVSDPGQSLSAGFGCSAGGRPAKVTCPAAGVTLIVANLGDGNDGFDSSAVAIAAYVHGGDGRDRIATGSGADTIDGDGGDDTLLARDGTTDSVTCGSGADSGQADVADRLAADCEATVERAAAPVVAPLPGPAPASPGTPAPSGTTQPGTGDDSQDDGGGTGDDGDSASDGDAGSGGGAGTAPVAIKSPATLQMSASGTIPIAVACTAASGSCRGTAELVELDGTVQARAVGASTAGRGVTLARASFTVAAGGQKTVRLRLDRRGRQRIIRKKKGKTRARIAISVTAPDGTVSTTRKTVTISAPRGRRAADRGR